MRAVLFMHVFAFGAAVVLAGPPGFDAVSRARIGQGPKMRLAALSYFGGAGTESLAGVVAGAGGEIVAAGNSWGPPFPAGSPEAVVMGPDAPRSLPLFAAGAPGDDWPHDTLPSALHPNRTGFLVRYSADLRTVAGVTRFGWGVGTVDAVALTPDGALVTAGMAREGFREAAGNAARTNRLPPGRGPRYGAALYGDTAMPGDVYVARWRDDGKGFNWVWILEKHVDPPARLFLSAEGRVVFDCCGVKSISADGATLAEIAVPAPPDGTDSRFLAGVHPRSGALLFAGSTFSRSGAKEWCGPLVEERDGEGKIVARYFDWLASLAWQPTIDLTAAAGVTRAAYAPTGHILVGTPSRLGRSVLERNPLDITEPVAKRGILCEELLSHGNRSRWGAGLRFSLARFAPGKTDDSAYAYWTGVSPEGRSLPAEELTLEGLRASEEGRVAVWGMSGGGVLNTFDVKPVGTNVAVIAAWKRRPQTPYLTVFSSDFAGVLWSGLLPRFRVHDVTSGRRGVIAVGAFRQPWKLELYESLAAPGAQGRFGGGYSDGVILLLEDSK